jgi:hypothetical protein
LLSKNNNNSTSDLLKPPEVVKKFKHGPNDDSNKKMMGLDLRPDREESKVMQEKSEFTLVGHCGPVYSVHISVDDKFLISGS